MLFKSATMTQASGSIGGMTASHNSSGMYFRARTIPTNPGSDQQNVVRNNLNTASTRWSNTLTQAQRNAWQVYADNTLLTNALGDPLKLSGQQMYIRCNTPRIQAEIPSVDDAPVTMGTPEVGTIVFENLFIGSGEMDLEVTAAGPWAAADDNYLLMYLGRPIGAARQYFKGPWRFVDFLEGNTATPLTGSQTIDWTPSDWPYAIGQKANLCLRVTDSEGRLSGKVQLASVITGPT